MGITGLLPFLKKIHEPVNVSKFSGCTVAIDAYCWLHKGAFSCAEKLALGEKTDQYVYYCMKFINYLLSHNIKPVMVFDGCHLPSKKLVETSRREKRDSNRKKAAQFLREGRRAEARECLQRSIDISPEMALNLMNTCRDRGVDCIVAPYEADSQLAYLNKIGVADVIITEDSDLLLFGCEKVLFKMDHAGNGLLMERRRLNEVTELPSEVYTFEKFRYMCIMSGCDYLASLPGIGLVRANKVFKIARQPDIQLLLKKLSTYLKTNITVPQEYINSFIQADNTFLYMLVYDPLTRDLVPLNPYPPGVHPEDMTYAGTYVGKEKALQIALGNINIYNGEKFAHFDPETFVPKHAKKKSDMLHMRSIWDKAYRVRPKVALREAQLSDRPLLKGKEVTIRSNLKRHSPKKRVREAEDSPVVKSNTELYGMYNNASPMKKKPRTEEVKDELHRFMFAEAKEEDTQSGDEEETKPVQTGPIRSPKFFNSLSKAHPGVKTDLDTSQENDSDKENGLKSPTRNIFASKSPAKKPKFDLNAPKPKKVISRFFANSEKKTPAQDVKSQDSNLTLISGYKFVHHTGTDTPESTAEEQPDLPLDFEDNKGKGSPFQFSKEKLSCSQNSQTSSPGGSFTWSKFKFGGKDSTSSPVTSSKVTKGFKKVVSESMLDKFLKNKSKESVEDKRTKGDKSGLIDNSGDVVSSLASDSYPESPASQEPSSLPYSIDSFCVDTDLCESLSQTSCVSDKNSQESTNNADNSQKRRVCSIYDFKRVNKSSDTENLTKKENNSGESSEHCAGNNEELPVADGSPLPSNIDAGEEDKTAVDVVCLLDSDDEESDHRSTSNQDKRKPTTLQKTATKGSGKPGCRVSGLSKRTSKKAAPVNDSRQQNLKDMFKRFAHGDSAKQKLSHRLSVESDAEGNPSTPEGTTSLIQSGNLATKRKLLDTS